MGTEGWPLLPSGSLLLVKIVLCDGVKPILLICPRSKYYAPQQEIKYTHQQELIGHWAVFLGFSIRRPSIFHISVSVWASYKCVIIFLLPKIEPSISHISRPSLLQSSPPAPRLFAVFELSYIGWPWTWDPSASAPGVSGMTHLLPSCPTRLWAPILTLLHLADLAILWFPTH